MSIAAEIERIASAKAELKAAINSRGGNLTTELLGDYAAAVTALPSGSGGSTTLPAGLFFSSGGSVFSSAVPDSSGFIDLVSGNAVVVTGGVTATLRGATLRTRAGSSGGISDGTTVYWNGNPASGIDAWSTVLSYPAASSLPARNRLLVSVNSGGRLVLDSGARMTGAVGAGAYHVDACVVLDAEIPAQGTDDGGNPFGALSGEVEMVPENPESSGFTRFWISRTPHTITWIDWDGPEPTLTTSNFNLVMYESAAGATSLPVYYRPVGGDAYSDMPILSGGGVIYRSTQEIRAPLAVAGSPDEAITVSSGGLLTVSSGGSAPETTVEFGGAVCVESGGIASGRISRSPGAALHIASGAVVTSAHVEPDAGITAVASDVLAGKTFRNDSGVVVSGALVI